ncbi:MAG: phosphoenolpyruvate carboxykinase [Halanaerobiales bacterium]|nr:phosphoenolpyruvate carboxykinase [Halanaerobiales bacterium]
MSTIERFEKKEILSRIRTTVETAFYRNNVVRLDTPSEAYRLAKESPGTIVTDMPIYQPEKLGLPQDATVLLFNDGAVKGRCAAARRIVGEPGVELDDYAAKIREAIYDTRYRKMYHCQAYAGLHEDFMVKLHLLIPENHENIALSWLLNFQYINEFYYNMYENSTKLENEGDIYIFSDPDWKHPDHPLGLTFFDPEHNVAALLGMRYFGEHKKGTLTLAWGTANRNGYACCHGGLKRYNLEDKNYVVAVFGLSGSGKSTITHAKHGGKYDVTVLHDDAFIINVEDGSSIALEPAYFDKTQDYPMASEDNKYILTAQNTGATVDQDGNVVLVTEDIRNGNGRAVKSKLWSPNRVDKIEEKADAVFWLMKDPTLPPVVKINGSSLASAMGATLATKRTSAERLPEGVDPNALVVEPYANPFRTYPLKDDYMKFKALFDTGIDCYILNTGEFMGKNITPAVTLGVIEAIIEGRAEFKQWANFSDLEIMEIEGYEPDFTDENYLKQFKARMEDRVAFIESRKTERGGLDQLPEDALEAIKKVVTEIENLDEVIDPL